MTATPTPIPAAAPDGAHRLRQPPARQPVETWRGHGRLADRLLDRARSRAPPRRPRWPRTRRAGSSSWSSRRHPALGPPARGRGPDGGGAAARLLERLERSGGAHAGPAPAGRARLVHRRLQRRAEPDRDDPRGGPHARSTRWTGSARLRRRGTRGSTTTWRSSDRAVDRIGGPVNLIGDCQGGWLAAIYAALQPRSRPHADPGRRPDRLPRRRRGDRRLRAHARPARRPVLLPGHRRCGRRRAEGRADAGRLRDDQAGERGREAARTARAARRRRPRGALPGVRGLVQAHPGHPRRVLPLDRRAPVPRQQAGARASSTTGGARVDLASVDCPLYLLAGEADHITPPPQVFAMADAAPRRRRRP